MKTFEFILLILCIFLTANAFASQFTTVTGQGYYTWNGQIIAYYSFNPNYTFNLVNGVTATDTSGAPSEIINQQTFNSYICNQNGKSC